MRFLILLLLLSCDWGDEPRLLDGVSDIKIYNGHRDDFLYIKFSSDTAFERIKSKEFGQPLEFYGCTEMELIIVGDISVDLKYPRPMLVTVDGDTVYENRAVNHRVRIDLKHNTTSHYFGKGDEL